MTGQIGTTHGSEATVAQPVSETIVIVRTMSRGVENLSLDATELLRGFEAFGKAACALSRAPKCEQEQEDCARDDAVAQGHSHPWTGGDPGQESDDHRGPFLAVAPA